MPDIIQISHEPISHDRLMTEADIQNTPEYHGVIDYVYEEPLSKKDLGDAVKLLLTGQNDACKALLDMQRDDEGVVTQFKFLEGFRDAFFAESYVGFQEALDRLTEANTKAAFCGGALSSRLYDLNQRHDDEYSTYVYYCDELWTLSAFVRSISLNTPYYIGSALVYAY